MLFPIKYSQDKWVEVLRTEIFKAVIKTVHLIIWSYMKIALLKVGNNFLIEDFIFLYWTYWTRLQKCNHKLDSLIVLELIQL